MQLLRVPEVPYVNGFDELRAIVKPDMIRDIKNNEELVFKKLLQVSDSAFFLPDVMCRVIASYVH